MPPVTLKPLGDSNREDQEINFIAGVAASFHGAIWSGAIWSIDAPLIS
jgi:hypothetical protein